DYVTAGGSIQVDGTAGVGSTLELQTTTINGNDLGSLNVDGLLEADNGTANTIENFSAGKFTSDGKIWVTGNATLTLKSDTLQDYVTAGGSIQVDGTAGVGSTLELQTTTINGNDLGSLNVDGLLEADNGTANTIENFSAGKFTSDGKIWVTGNATLTLKSDTLQDYVTAGGSIQVDGTAGVGSTLELQTTTINGNDLGSLNVDGLLEADN